MRLYIKDMGLKGVWHEIFNFRFFYESVSPEPPSTPLGPFQIFQKLAEIFANDIGDKLLIGVNDTGDKFITSVLDTSD